MSSLLHIEVSPMGDNSVSRQVSKEFLSHWKGTVVERDLNANPVPHLDGETIFAGYTPEDARPATMVAKHQLRMDLIAEITGVDHILVSTPMWNWSVPSVLKAYIDQIVLPGVLDGSGADGLKGKRVTIVISMGGSYAPGAPRHGWDYESGFLKLVFAALGATDIEVIISEFSLAGVAPGMEQFITNKEASISAGKEAARLRATS